ncbi:hypothetical protein ACA910_015319 [Epithemia clementina (nom. ined.)]
MVSRFNDSNYLSCSLLSIKRTCPDSWRTQTFHTTPFECDDQPKDPHKKCKQSPITPPPTTASSTSKKSVHFNERSNLYFSDTIRKTQCDCQVTWYSPREYEAIYLELRCLISAARNTIRNNEEKSTSTGVSFFQSMESMVKLTTKAVVVLQNKTNTEQDQWQQEHEPFFLSVYQQQQHPHCIDDNSWYLEEWLGLEMHLIPSMAHESNQRRFLLQAVVRDVQAEYQANPSLWTTAEVERELRHCSCNFSHAMALLAHWMAKASAAAA